MFKRVSIFLYALVMVALVVFDPLALRTSPNPSEGKYLNIELSRGALTVLDFPSRKKPPSAIMLLGSGDGGWGDLEEAISRAFQNQGYEVIGIDFHTYAHTDYDLSILQSDFGKIAQTVTAPWGSRPPPLIVAGYSMGAAQAIAVAGGPHPPHGLIGLLLVDPLSRGRYGLRQSDQINILPEGAGTFSAGSFSNKVGTLRIVQWHAEGDSIDSRDWLRSLSVQYKIFTFPNTGHFYNTDREKFLPRLVESAQWILNPGPDDTATEKAGANHE